MMGRIPIAKSDPKCSCVTGQYECWHCRKPMLEAIERSLTAAQREYPDMQRDLIAMRGMQMELQALGGEL